MLRTVSFTASALILILSTQAHAQITGGTGTTQGSGAGTQGSGTGLSSRFSSNFERFQTGSTAENGTVGVASSAAGLGLGSNLTGNALNIGGARGIGGGLGGFGGGFGGRGGLQGFGVLGGNQGLQQGQQQQQTIRTRLVLGFTPRADISPEIARRFEQRINRMSRFTFVEKVTIVLEDGRAVLRGAVTSEHERDLIEQIARFEPSIDDIENEIHVAPRPAAPEALPLPSAPARRP